MRNPQGLIETSFVWFIDIVGVAIFIISIGALIK